jgi:hypothetical protein
LRFCVGDSTVTAGKVTLDCARAIVTEEEQPASKATVPMKKCARLTPARFGWSPTRRQTALTFTSIHFQDEISAVPLAAAANRKNSAGIESL